MSDIAIRVENLSKLYPAVAPRARHIGRAQQRHDTLRDALSSAFRGQGSGVIRHESPTPDTDLWDLRDVSFEVKQGEVVGIIGRNGAEKSTLPSTVLRAAPRRGRTRLKILSHIIEPMSGRAETFGGRVASLLDAARERLPRSARTSSTSVPSNRAPY